MQHFFLCNVIFYNYLNLPWHEGGLIQVFLAAGEEPLAELAVLGLLPDTVGGHEAAEEGEVVGLGLAHHGESISHHSEEMIEFRFT